MQKVYFGICSAILTIILNILVDGLLLKKDTFTSFIKSFWKDKKYILIYSMTTIVELILLYYMGIDKLYYLYYFVIFFMMRIAIIDYETKYIENKVLIFLAITSVVSMAFYNNIKISDALITGAVTFVVLFVLSKITRGSIGAGDSYVLGLLGAICGYEGLLAVLALAGVLVFVVSLVLIIKSRSNKNKQLAFTPFITAALFAVLIINNM